MAEFGPLPQMGVYGACRQPPLKYEKWRKIDSSCRRAEADSLYGQLRWDSEPKPSPETKKHLFSG